MAHATIDGGGGGPDAALAAESTPPAALAWKKAGWAALQLFAAGGVFALIGAFLASKIDGRLVDTCCAILPTALFATGFLRGLQTLYLLARARGLGFGALGAAVIVFPVLVGGFFTLVGTFLTMWSTTGFSRGRQLRKGAKLLLPPVASGDGWDTTDIRATAPETLRSDLAKQWRENGRTEHASVAAFARLTLNLIALGAPSSVIEAANRDSLAAVRALPNRISYSLEEQARDGAWEAHGIPGQQLESEEHTKARAHLVEKVARLASAQLARAA
jgi:hypothetical protein